MSQFGCDVCMASEASEAWEKYKGMPIEARLIDESHYKVSIRACPSCSQHYLHVFTEMIDWEDGQDPVDQTIIPIEAAERAHLFGCQPLDETTINKMGPGRRSLRYDWPKGKNARFYWSVGIHVGRYD